MTFDFNQLNLDEYELFLPTPVFSELEINKVLMPNTLFKGVIIIECEPAFLTHVEVTGDFLRLEQDVYEGRRFAVAYNIDTTHCPSGMTLKGEVLFTYLGGETTLPVQVFVDYARQPMIPEVGQEVSEPLKARRSTRKSYTVHTGKKAYNLEETAAVVIMNHEAYPMTVSVKDTYGHLLVEQKHLTVQDIGVLKVSLKQTFMERFITKKHYKKPVIHHTLHLSVRHDKGEDQVHIPVSFTTYDTINAGKAIIDDRTYKKQIMTAQTRYNHYIVKGNVLALQNAKSLIEEAMAYHATDVELRLFYILLLCEYEKKDEVLVQINEILKYSGYYLDDNMDEFIEILNAVGDWLLGKKMDHQLNSWPLTNYRQLFKLRVFKVDAKEFRDYETLYNHGFKSSHLFAHAAESMRRQPLVPTSRSPFFKGLLMWAISKDAINNTWIDAIDQSSHQMVACCHINGLGAERLYLMHPSIGTLKVLVSVMIREGKNTPKEHAIYLEALKNNCFVKGLQESYVRTAYLNRLLLDFDEIHLHGLMRSLSSEETIYLIRCYLAEELTDKSPHAAVMRRYRELLTTFVGRRLSADEMALVHYDLSVKVPRNQWKDITSVYDMMTLEDLFLDPDPAIKEFLSQGIEALGYSWFHKRVPAELLLGQMDEVQLAAYVNWLIQEDHDDVYMTLNRGGSLTKVPEAQRVQWAVMLLKKSNVYGYVVARELYEAGLWNTDLLKNFQGHYSASLRGLLDLFHHLHKEDVLTEAFLVKLLYKGVVTRLFPEEVLRAYLVYRARFADKSVMTHLNTYFAARILIEEAFGYETLIQVFESDLSLMVKEANTISPMSLALLRLYQYYGENKTVIAGNLIKNAVKNGIIFPWFADIAKPYLQTGALRKAAFFSYHSKPWLEVKMHYRCDDQSTFETLPMKHVFFGFYIGYVLAFYKDNVEYYFEESTPMGHREITESGIYVHDVFTEPEGVANNYDVINTIIMSEEMQDDESVETVIREHIANRAFIHSDMKLL